MQIKAYKCSDGSIVETLEEWQKTEIELLFPDEVDAVRWTSASIAQNIAESRDKIIAILTGEAPPKPRAKRCDAGKTRPAKPGHVQPNPVAVRPGVASDTSTTL